MLTMRDFAKTVTYTIYCKSFEVGKFRAFHESISNPETFLAYAIDLGHARLLSTVNFSKLHFSSATVKLFHLKQFAIAI